MNNFEIDKLLESRTFINVLRAILVLIVLLVILIFTLSMPDGVMRLNNDNPFTDFLYNVLAIGLMIGLVGLAFKKWRMKAIGVLCVVTIVALIGALFNGIYDEVNYKLSDTGNISKREAVVTEKKAHEITEEVYDEEDNRKRTVSKGTEYNIDIRFLDNDKVKMLNRNVSEYYFNSLSEGDTIMLSVIDGRLGGQFLTDIKRK